jgi:hypothetical protein
MTFDNASDRDTFDMSHGSLWGAAKGMLTGRSTIRFAEHDQRPATRQVVTRELRHVSCH